MQSAADRHAGRDDTDDVLSGARGLLVPRDVGTSELLPGACSAAADRAPRPTMQRPTAPPSGCRSRPASVPCASPPRADKPWHHHQLDRPAREQLIRAYREAERNDSIFRWAQSTAGSLQLWPALVLGWLCLLWYLQRWVLLAGAGGGASPADAVATGCTTSCASAARAEPTLAGVAGSAAHGCVGGGGTAQAAPSASHVLLDFAAAVSGILALQLIFVVSHTMAHARMLEYSEHKLGSSRLNQGVGPIYFFAFYHHHSSRQDDWAPFLSYNGLVPGQSIWDHLGTRGVIGSHWVGYSHLSFLCCCLRDLLHGPVAAAADHHQRGTSGLARTSAGAVLGVFALLLCTSRIWPPFLLGYEVGTLLLPMAHGWQHIPRQCFGRRLGAVLLALERAGVIANKADHHSHHQHTHPNVYRSFSSSGIYGPSFDRIVNHVWDSAFEKPNAHLKPFDVLMPTALVTIGGAVVVPLVCLLVTEGLLQQ